jgi:hypothetical protein
VLNTLLYIIHLNETNLTLKDNDMEKKEIESKIAALETKLNNHPIRTTCGISGSMSSYTKLVKKHAELSKMLESLGYFTLISNDFGPRFSFRAKDLESAISKIKGWCLYHSFCYREEYSVIEVEAKDALYNCNGSEFMDRF